MMTHEGGGRTKKKKTWEIEHTVEWLHTRQIDLPAHVLTIDFSKIGNKERILAAGLTLIRINAFNVRLQCVRDHRLGQETGVRVGLGEAALLGRHLYRRRRGRDVRGEFHCGTLGLDRLVLVERRDLGDGPLGGL